MEEISLLVVEDNPKHMADVRAEMQGRIDAGLEIKVDYATTLTEARQLLREKAFDGIISDIFFPYDDTIKEGPLVGWSSDIAYLCNMALQGCYPTRPEYEELVDSWLEGRAMHPAGVYLAKKEALKKGTPFVFCTDTNHHGYKTEPVNRFARKHNIPLVDTCAGRYDESDKKEWRDAYNSLILQLIQKKLGDKPESIDEKTEYARRGVELIDRYVLKSDLDEAAIRRGGGSRQLVYFYQDIKPLSDQDIKPLSEIEKTGNDLGETELYDVR